MHFRPLVALATVAALASACANDQSPTEGVVGLGNRADARPGGCRIQDVGRAVNAVFEGATDTYVSSLVNDLRQARNGGDASAATLIGYEILDSLSTAGRVQGTPEDGSALALATLACMNLGSAALPASFVGALSPGGAFAVRNRSASDAAPVESELVDGTSEYWVLQPPGTSAWRAIADVAGDVTLSEEARARFLAYGQPSAIADADFTRDQLASDVFEWETIPTTTFPNGGGVLVGVCNEGDPLFLQHYAFGDAAAEILGYQPLACAQSVASADRPASLLARLAAYVLPTPLHARRAITGTAGSKGALSPFGKVNPGAVNLSFTSRLPKQGNTVNVFFEPTITVANRSNGGTPFKQNVVFVWLEVIGNQGVNAEMCNNYAYSGDDGFVRFPKAFLNKAGGYTIVAKTIGTVSKPEAVGEFVPTVPAGTSASSPLINIKNDETIAPPTSCAVYRQGDPLPAYPGPNGL